MTAEDTATSPTPPMLCNNGCCEDGQNEFGTCTLTAENKCVVACDANCTGSTLRCPLNGACTARDGECVVGGDEDCKQSQYCSKFDRCIQGFYGEGCITAADANSFCASTDVCKQFGACKGTDGNCVNPKNPSDCKHSYMCKMIGQCSWNGKRCLAMTLADCDGVWCGPFCEIRHGECSLQQNDAACQWHEGCQHSGRCRFIDGKCRPGSEADCLQSDQCIKHGYCSYVEKKAGEELGRYCCDANGQGCQ